MDSNKLKEMLNKLNSISSSDELAEPSIKSKIKSVQLFLHKIQSRLEESNAEN